MIFTKVQSALVFLFVYATCLNAQESLQRTSINSLGGSVSLGGMLIRQTVGQPYGTSTSISNDFNYRPGFQQPLFLIKNIKQSIAATIFPNPTIEEVNIETSLTINQASIKIFDVSGKLINRYDFQELKSCKIDCKTLPAGTYFLVISDKKSDLSTNKLIVSR